MSFFLLECLYLGQGRNSDGSKGPFFAFSSLCCTSSSSLSTIHYIPSLSSRPSPHTNYSDKRRYNEATEMSPTDAWIPALEACRSLHSVLFPSRHTWSVSIIPKCLALLKALMWRTVPTSCEWNVISLKGKIENYGGGGSVRAWWRRGILSLAAVISTDALDWWDGGKPHNWQTDKATIAVIRTADRNSFRVASTETSLRA
jgi:hypothetical protein